MVGKSLESPTFQTFHELAERQSPSPKLDLALEWLRAHPEDMTIANRLVAEKLGVSHAWVGKAKRILRNEDE